MKKKLVILAILMSTLFLTITACGNETKDTEVESMSGSQVEAGNITEDDDSNFGSQEQVKDSENKLTEDVTDETESEGVQESMKPNDSADTQTKPSESQTKPSDIQTKPLDSETKPSESQTKPSDSQTRPSDTQAKPSDSQTKPLESEDEPTITEEPSKPEEKPSESQQIPTSSEKLPVDSEDDITSEPTEVESSEEQISKQKYIVTLKTKGGYRLYNIKVHVYADDTKQELVLTAATGSNGSAIIELPPSEDYIFTISNVPEGYKYQSVYRFDGTTTSVVLESGLITGKDILTTKLGEGDVMYDFSVTNVEGETLALSDILKEKKMVVLNFWYVNCAFCVAEFPYMSSAYEKYADDIEIIALNPFDNIDAVKTFLDENPLPFEVATCQISLPGVFGVQAYPVSIVVDRYGVIREIEKEAILEENGFIQLFKKYTR